MLSESLSVREFGDVTYLALAGGLMVSGGMLGGATNFYLSERRQVNPTTLGRELLIGIICAITVPLFLDLLSSPLLTARKTAALEHLSLFAVVVVYTIAMRRLFFIEVRQAVQKEVIESGLSFLDIEILRGLERRPIAPGGVPDLPPDLRVSQTRIASRLQMMMDRGLVAARLDEQNRSELYVTAEGWASLNRTLQSAAE